MRHGGVSSTLLVMITVPRRADFFFTSTPQEDSHARPAKPGGAEIFKKLIASTERLIEKTISPATWTVIGLGYEVLAINPRLVMVLSRLGQPGRSRDWKGTDLINGP